MLYVQNETTKQKLGIQHCGLKIGRLNKLDVFIYVMFKVTNVTYKITHESFLYEILELLCLFPGILFLCYFYFCLLIKEANSYNKGHLR